MRPRTLPHDRTEKLRRDPFGSASTICRVCDMSDSFAAALNASSARQEWVVEVYRQSSPWADWISHRLNAVGAPVIIGHSLGSVVARTVLADESHRAVELVRSKWAAHDLTRRILQSSEECTGLPLITSLVDDPSFRASTPHARTRLWAFASLAELDQAAKELARVRKALRDILRTLLGGYHYAFDDHPPPHASSPCGVIRFAAPVVPRAPGSTAASPAPSSICVLAA